MWRGLCRLNAWAHWVVSRGHHANLNDNYIFILVSGCLGMGPTDTTEYFYFSNQVPKGAFTFNSHDCLTYIKQHMTPKSVHIKD